MQRLYVQIRARLVAWGPDRCLTGLVVVLAVLLVFQGGRYVFGGPSAWGLNRLVNEGARTPERTGQKAITAYDPILDKGLLGKRVRRPQGPSQSISVFGVLGNEALIGQTSNDAKPFEVGAKLPGGEKLVEVDVSSVVVEKDGKKRTLSVFPAISSPVDGSKKKVKDQPTIEK